MTIDLHDGPDPTLISSALEFIRALRLLKVHVGDPSWRELSRRTRVAHTTLASVLDQRRAHLPSLENTTALVRGLGLTEAQVLPWLAAWRRVRTAGATATTATWISRHDLPRDVPTFTGRTREMDVILAGCAAADPAAPLIWTVDGMPGVGKPNPGI